MAISNIFDSLGQAFLPMFGLLVRWRWFLVEKSFRFSFGKPFLHLLCDVDLRWRFVRVDRHQIIFVHDEVILRFVNNLNVIGRRGKTVMIRSLLPILLENHRISRSTEVTETRKGGTRATDIDPQQIHRLNKTLSTKDHFRTSAFGRFIDRF